MLSTTKEIKKALGSKGKKLAKIYFNQYWNNQFGNDFNILVRNSIVKALSEVNPSVSIAPSIKGNTADSLAGWFDR